MLRIIGATDRGLERRINEDRFAGEALSPGFAYGVVCDGLGGENAGGVASAVACEEIRRMLEGAYRPGIDQRSVYMLLEGAIANANAMVFDEDSYYLLCSLENIVEDGQLDANYFQHITYMNNFNEDSGTHLVSVAGLHYEPFGIYAGKTASLDARADGAVVAIPNDHTNGGRALLLLQEQGLITLKDGVGLEPTVEDIADNPQNFEIKQLTANLLTTTLQDVDVAVINGNYAIGAGLKASEALVIESADGIAGTAYVNVLAVKEGNENNEAILKLVEVLKSDEVRQFIEEKYEGGVVPVD